MPQLQIFLSEDHRIAHDLNDERTTIGRLADNILQIDDPSVSSHHAEIVYEDGQYHLRDSGSTNGTFVNGEHLSEAVLRHGDEIRFGRVEGVFFTEAATAAPPSQAMPESAGTYLQAASRSVRPANFVSSSPSPKNTTQKDPLAAGAYAISALALLAAAAAAYFIFSVQTPA